MKHISILCQFQPFGLNYVNSCTNEWKYFLQRAPTGEEEEIFYTSREVVWSRSNILKKKFLVHSDIIKVVWTSFSRTNKNSDLCILHQGTKNNISQHLKKRC